LIVDGFDRLDGAALIPQWESPALGTARRMFLERMNRQDYAVEHAVSLAACGLAFDGAVNEAIGAGIVPLTGYPAVDWFVGEDSVADEALSDAERALLAGYLDGGGRLLISGAETGYDLVEEGRDPAFFHDYLRAEYVGDDAQTYDFAGVAGGPFDGLVSSFDDSTNGTYDVDCPDRLDAAGGSTVVLDYAGGTADGAAVAYRGSFRLVHFGFPLETVTDATNRTDLFCAAADYLLVPDQPPTPCHPRLINPGFEGGVGQSAWQVSAPSGVRVLTHRDDLPTYVQPHDGDWLAWLQPDLTASTALTQPVALPAGEPTATLSLAWFLHGPTAGDTMVLDIHDSRGLHQTRLLTVTDEAPADAWQAVEFDLSAFSGETVQLVLRASSSATHFFVDDVSLITCGSPGPGEFRALWVDAWHDGIKNPEQVRGLVETARAGNFNALVVQVRRRGDTYYPSVLDPWAPDADPTFDALGYLIQVAHAAGIEVHAWATALAIWNATTPPAAPEHIFNLHGPGAEGRDYWLMTNSTGAEVAGSVYYLDPGHPDVADYTVAAYAELAASYDLDGIHLDRVRYAWQDWGYNPASVSRFQAETGRADWPVPADEEWLQWRRDQVTSLVRRIYLTVIGIDPDLTVSAALSAAGSAPHASLPWETRTPYTHHLQDWPAWLEEGILDLGLPMNYRDEDTDALDFDRWIAWEADHQYDRAVVIGTGLYKNAIEDSLAQMRRVRQPSVQGNQPLGLCGNSYAAPNDSGMPRRAFVNAVVTGVFTQAATSPALFWKGTPTQGHLMGKLTRASARSVLAAPLPAQTGPCLSLASYPLALTGPQNRALSADGSGWFGAVDLPPGEYQLTVDLLSGGATISQSVSVSPGVVIEQQVVLPACQSWYVYLPLVVRQAPP
jgi:uncharacterized lipoprotein YddW (UPF0748 family)